MVQEVVVASGEVEEAVIGVLGQVVVVAVFVELMEERIEKVVEVDGQCC